MTSSRRCNKCIKCRSSLRSSYANYVRPKDNSAMTASSSRTNLRYICTPQRSIRMKNRKAQVRTKTRQIKKLEERLANVVKSKRVDVDEGLHGGLLDVMKTTPLDNEDIFPEGSLRKLFWMQQMKAASVSDKRQMWWHPLIIRWCLSLKLSSSAAYQAMKDTGFITLPCEHTLRDYTHVFRPKPGIQHEVNDQLAAEAKLDQLEEWQTHVCIVFDEVKIKEDDKYTGYILGFTDLGTINQEIDKLEKIRELML